MSSPTESTDDTLLEAPAMTWTLTLVHHPDCALLGRRIELGNHTLRLGRDSEVFGPGTFETKAISRTHLHVEMSADGPYLRDQSSKNGTFLNGHRVEESALQPGDVVGLGDRLLIVGYSTNRALERKTDGQEETGPEGSSIAIATARATARRLVAGSAPVIIVGEHGAGKNVFAKYIHAISGRSPFVVLHPGAFTDTSAPEALFGTSGNGILASASGGTLLLDDLQLAGPKLQAALLQFLDGGAIPRLNGALENLDVRTVVATSLPVEHLVERGLLSSELAGRLGMSVIEVPPLRTRPEDIAVLFRTALREAGIGSHVRVDARLMLAILRCPWPGNVRELRSFARLVAESADESSDRIELTPEHLLSLRAAPDLLAVSFATSDNELLVARNGSWFASGGERIDLSRRPHLARLLAVLVSHHEGSGGETAVSVATLFRAGWPDERVAKGPASARVYVAIGTLRKLGLRRHLESEAGGYRLSPLPRTRIVASGLGDPICGPSP